MLIGKQSPHGGDIYSRPVELDFSANTNPYGMPEPVREALIRAAGACSVYPDPYCTGLRRGLSGAEGLPPEQILCGNGAAELIYQFCYALPRGTSAAVVCPTFSEYETALRAAGIPVTRHLLTAKNGFQLTPAVLELPAPGVSAIFLCSPNNPTGITVKEKYIHLLAERCHRTGTRLFLDLCFLDLSDDPHKYPVSWLVREYPEVFVLKAFTKSYAMAGVRLGYALCSDGAFLRLVSEKSQCWNVSALAQAAGEAALSCGDHVERSRLRLRESREALADGLRGLGLQVFCGEANYLLLRGPADLADRLLEAGILIRSCGNYPGLDATYFRVAVRTPEENERLLSAMGRIL